MKRVIIACATGVATSTLLCQKVERLAGETGTTVNLIQCKISEVDSRQGEADLIIATSKLPKEYGIPAIKATALITGVGAEKVEEEIRAALRE